MNIYQLKTPSQFKKDYGESLTEEQLMAMYAMHVATKFAAECVNEALGNKKCVSNSLCKAIDFRYRNINWENE